MTKIHILYLCGGNAARFGENKLLVPYKGKPLFRHGLEMLSGIRGKREDVTLTVVSRYEQILSYAKEKEIPSVFSRDSEKGASYTIRAGIESLGKIPEEDFLLFVVGDQPLLSEETVLRVMEKAIPQTETARAAFEGKPGNPVLFSAKLIPELLELTGDEGGRSALKRHDCILVNVFSAEELADVDTKEDLDSLGN